VALAEAGADVALAARSKAALEETAELATRAGRRAVVVPTDVSSYAEVDALIHSVDQGEPQASPTEIGS